MKCIKATVYHEGQNKVSAIKMWRTITGAGLKESKDFIDTIFDGGYPARKLVVLNMAQYGEFRLASVTDMELAGLYITEVVRFQKESLNDFSNIPQ